QAEDYKAGAVTAQRAADIVTRKGQPHVYRPLLTNSKTGYWPAGALKENDVSTGKWQELAPKVSGSCAVFPNNEIHQEDARGAYAWALWRPYSCCKRRGQVFLGSMNF
ncbi:MAG: TraU family protein, partial [Saezia sp.]